jgi:hypothetical protein
VNFINNQIRLDLQIRVIGFAFPITMRDHASGRILVQPLSEDMGSDATAARPPPACARPRPAVMTVTLSG